MVEYFQLPEGCGAVLKWLDSMLTPINIINV